MAAPRFISDLAGTRRNQFRILPAGVAGPPPTGAHHVGELHMDSLVSLWRCTASGTPGTWVNSADVSGGAAPALVTAIPTVLDAIYVGEYGVSRWAVTFTKGALRWLVEIVGASAGATASDARPTSLQIGAGTVDVTLSVDVIDSTMRLVATAATSGWSAAWKRIG